MRDENKLSLQHVVWIPNQVPLTLKLSVQKLSDFERARGCILNPVIAAGHLRSTYFIGSTLPPFAS